MVVRLLYRVTVRMFSWLPQVARASPQWSPSYWCCATRPPFLHRQVGPPRLTWPDRIRDTSEVRLGLEGGDTDMCGGERDHQRPSRTRTTGIGRGRRPRAITQASLP
jgi:hypothetical protein